ncbi:AAA family ATPase [Arcanobacterium wilhelmae]|uniref:AAA family ATPase n=1 Tax=Arcanobacterium wilhelmae TaxID=1803177 RepID=UPI002414DF41|nr:AAA family ATPase [Arcanobacterium wilhelmae]WFN91128.1 AAA family ATPase [Arcanobacterium wilhelmae]
MRGPIRQIRVNSATFTDCTVDLSYLNFFFGRNGAGKSTIARTLGLGHGLTWDTNVDADDYSVMVYDRGFVDENFSTYESLNGVFTLGKANIEAEKKLAILRQDRDEHTRVAKHHEDEASAKQAQLEQLTANFHDECWEKSKDLRDQFSETQHGRKQKRTFAEAVLTTADPKEQDLSELEALYTAAFDKQATTHPLLDLVDIQPPDDRLMGAAIVNTANTDFARFIDTINAADWVRHGNATFSTSDGDPCPFCQQELPEGFTETLVACFDDAYEQSLADLQTFADTYKAAARQAWNVPLSTTMTAAPPQLETKEYDTYVELLRAKLQANVETIEHKLRTPSSQLQLDDTTSVIDDLNQLITDANEAIEAHNKVVANQKQQRKICTERVWQHIADHLAHIVTSYGNEAKKLADEIDAATLIAKSARASVKDLDTQIQQLLGSVVNTSVVKEQINTVLRESGFQGFHLDDVPGKKNAYRVVRLDGTTAENLSEGERNFIAFLYFYFLIQGSLEQAEYLRNNIVVIDDPVSSMDSGAMFIVAAHIRELIKICQNNVDYRHDTGRGNHIKQIIILSHNPYFYREVSYPNLNDYRYASYFLIKKTDNVSRVNLCVRHGQDAPSQKENYTPVLNSYAALWNEYKEASSSITVLNVTRRILEHYFLQLCGYDSADLTTTLLKDNRDKFIHTNGEGIEDLADYHLVTSMLTCISHHKNGLEDDTYLIAEDHDPNQLRHIFQLIFTLMGQEQHYKMMNGQHAVEFAPAEARSK